MNISSFDDLLQAARQQPEPQRLLFVFADAALPDDSTPEQRAQFQSGQGGTLIPQMSVDEGPAALTTFGALVEESRRFGGDWAVVFVAGLAGRSGRAPTSDEADKSLTRMVEDIKAGSFGSYLPFDRLGNPMLIG